MCKIKEPEVTAEKLFYAITNSAVDLGEPGRDEMYGFGKVNAQAALQKIDEPYVPVTGVTVIPEIFEMEVGETNQLTAEIIPEDATNKNVSWSTDNLEVAVVDQTGLVTAITTGTAIITVTTECGGYTDTATVTVTEPVLEIIDLKVIPTKVSLLKGDAKQITVIAKLDNGTVHNVTGTASYTSSDESVATVSSAGLVTAEGAGTAVITIEYEGITETIDVTVKDLEEIVPGVEEIIIIPYAMNLN